MSNETMGLVIAGIVAILGGAFGPTLLNRWFDRDKVHLEADGAERQLIFSDNEQARRFLQEQLAARDRELQSLRASEISLLHKVGELAAAVARQEERSDAQAKEIQALQAAVARWGADYVEMKAERDSYRAAKHESDNKLTGVTLRAELAEREVRTLRTEIDQLKGQLSALSPRRTTDGGLMP